VFKKHPRGLPVLFFTEFWERFGFYLMLGIFFLYMTDTQKGGLEMDRAQASDVMGTYLAAVYLTPFVGGLLADRVLGYRKSIVIGGCLMGTGYLLLAVPGMSLFWVALGFIVLGNGFFKPNISTLVGNLYNTEEYRASKDAGFNLFYMGINLGAFVCNFVAAILRNTFGWGWAFAAAGVGMFIGVIWFVAGQKHTAEADVLKPVRPGDMATASILGVVFIPAAIFGLVGWFVPTAVFGHPLITSQSNDAFLFACVPVVAYYLSLWLRAEKDEKGPIASLLAIMGVVVVFWAVFHQNSTALTTWAESYTDREVPVAIEPALEKTYMAQVVDTEPREVQKLDLHGVPILGADGSPITEMGPHPYFANIEPQARPPPEDKVILISTELFQSVNPFCVVIFTPLVVGAFMFLRRRKKEPSTPGKITLGLFISALSTLVMVAAVYAGDNGAMKVGPIWLIMAYAVVTVGELCLSPMGLSLVSKLSPPRITAIMMGGWFLSTAIGNKLSGLLAGLWDTYEGKDTFFFVNFGGLMIACAAIFFMLPWLKRVMREHLGE
jgi:POT family proton-dependent oligopeptide transporter